MSLARHGGVGFGLLVVILLCASCTRPPVQAPVVGGSLSVETATSTAVISGASVASSASPTISQTPLPATSTATTTPLPGPTATHPPPPTATSEPIATLTPTAPVVIPTPTLPPIDEATRSKRFDEVWQTVADNYMYRDFRGVDWNALRDQYRPQALTAATSEGFYETLKEMVAALGDRHSRYLSPQDARSEQALTSGSGPSYVGIGTIETGGFVLAVFQNSPAEQAGLKRRDRILTIDGHPFGSAEASLSGPEGSSVRLEISRPGSGLLNVDVERRGIVAKLAPTAYRLPGTNVGFLVVPWFWSEDMGAQVADALRGMLASGGLDGLIVDVRANNGGWRHVLKDVLSSFIEGTAGEFYRKETSYPFDIEPNDLYPRLRETPVVVLVDAGTQSYAEVFTAALQSRGRAQAIGVATAGNTETIFPHDFEDKSRLWLAEEGFRLQSGINLEGTGVAPDQIVDVDWGAYDDMNDPQIVRALELLNAR